MEAAMLKEEEIVLKLEALQSQLNAIKTGARNNAKDKKSLQAIHDVTAEMGASCGATKAAGWSQMIQSMHDTSVSLGADCGEAVKCVYAIKTETGEMVLDVLGVPFGGPYKGRDREGDYFDSKTNIHSDKFPEIPAVYYHGVDPQSGLPIGKPEYIGKAKFSHTDVRGHWYKVVLNHLNSFAQKIWDAAMHGVAGASSGSILHLMRKSINGHIDEWPVAEMTLTDSSGNVKPANPYAIAVPALKTIYEEAKIDTSSLESEDSGNESAQDANNKQTQKKKDSTMTKEEQEIADAKAAEERIADEKAKAVKTGSINVDEFQTSMERVMEETKQANEAKAAKEQQIAQLQEGMKTLISEAMKAAPATQGGGRGPAINKLKRGDSEMQAFKHWLKTGDVGAYKANVFLNESVVAEGEATVPIDFYNQIVRVLDVESFARAAGARVINTSLHTVNIPIQKNRWAAPVSTAESQTSTQTSADLNQVQPFDTVAATPLKYTRMVLLSDEYVNDDKANVLQFISDSLAQQYGLLENTLAVAELTSGVTAHQTAAAAAAVATADVNGLFYKVNQPYRNKGSWVGAGATQGAIASIQAYPFVYTQSPQGNAGGSGLETLLGRPFFNAADVTAIGANAKSLWFGNFSYMGLVQNGSLTIRRLNEAYAIYGQVAFLASLRIAFKTLQPEAFAYLVHPSA